MVLARLADTKASTPLVRAGVGGLKFFDRVRAGTSNEIHAALVALISGAQVPPFLATDEEGGSIEPLAPVVGGLPWANEIARQWSPAQLQSAVVRRASAMRAIGFTMDLAPVLDMAPATAPDLEGRRSFGPNSGIVTSYGSAVITGLTAGGIIPVPKHFPGLGHADQNTEIKPATVPPLAQLVDQDLIPFRHAVAGGIRAMMVGHQIVPGLTDGLPASLAPKTYAYLRQNMGFDGMVIVDALEMGSIVAAGFDGPAAAERAIEAGADMVILATPADVAPTLTRLSDAARSGRMAQSRIDDADRRIMAAKGIAIC